MRANVNLELSDLKSYGNSVQELREHLMGIPDNATFDITQHKGDRPYDTDTFTITINYV